MRCVEYLVEEAKADPLAQAKDGMTSIHAAAQGGHTRVAEARPISCTSGRGRVKSGFFAV